MSHTPQHSQGLPDETDGGNKLKRHQCSYCGKPGHLESRCWTKRRKSGVDSTTSSQANVASGHPFQWPGDYAFTSYSFLTNHLRHQPSDWYADSGASQHLSDQLWMFRDYTPVTPGKWPVVGIGSGNVPLQVHGHGNIPIKTRVEGVWNEGILQNVIFVPNLGVNLFSVKSATAHGTVCTFSINGLAITRGPKVVAIGTGAASNLYRLDIQPTQKEAPEKTIIQSSTAALAKASPQSITVWHRRLGHVSALCRFHGIVRVKGFLKTECSLVISNKTFSTKSPVYKLYTPEIL